MSIVYLCRHCRTVLNLSGFHAVNEAGRKCCEKCGSNNDDLDTIDKNTYLEQIKNFRADEDVRMSIIYLCRDCRTSLRLGGSYVVNQDGSKYCVECGSDYDNLEGVNEDRYLRLKIANLTARNETLTLQNAELIKERDTYEERRIAAQKITEAWRKEHNSLKAWIRSKGAYSAILEMWDRKKEIKE